MRGNNNLLVWAGEEYGSGARVRVDEGCDALSYKNPKLAAKSTKLVQSEYGRCDSAESLEDSMN